MYFAQQDASVCFSRERSMTAVPSSFAPSTSTSADMASPVLIAQANTGLPVGTPLGPLATAVAAPAGAVAPATLGTLSDVTPGVAVIHDGQRTLVQGSH